MIARHYSNRALFLAFVQEREAIRVRRAAGAPAPWTEDEILRVYRFTNVRRRDDRVSVWLREHVYSDKVFKVPTLVTLQLAALCRWVNWPPTLAAIMDAGFWAGEKLNLPQIGRLLDKRIMTDKTWTGAYLVRGTPEGGPKGHFIAEQVVGRALTRVWPAVRWALETGMRRPVWCALTECPSWGSFMAGQVVDDLTWTSLLPTPRDDATWAPQGPGSVRGLNRVLGLALRTRHEERAWCEHLTGLHAEVVERLGEGYSDLTLMDIQNCLCEWGKYCRVREGGPPPRSRYRPEGAY